MFGPLGEIHYFELGLTLVVFQTPPEAPDT